MWENCPETKLKKRFWSTISHLGRAEQMLKKRARRFSNGFTTGSKTVFRHSATPGTVPKRCGCVLQGARVREPDGALRVYCVWYAKAEGGKLQACKPQVAFSFRRVTGHTVLAPIELIAERI